MQEVLPVFAVLLHISRDFSQQRLVHSAEALYKRQFLRSIYIKYYYSNSEIESVQEMS